MELGMKEPHNEGGSDSTLSPIDALATRKGAAKRSQGYAGCGAQKVHPRWQRSSTNRIAWQPSHFRPSPASPSGR